MFPVVGGWRTSGYIQGSAALGNDDWCAGCCPDVGLVDLARRCNVDMLKLIQLGLTFTDAEGNLPTCNGELSVWQFNFKCAHAS